MDEMMGVMSFVLVMLAIAVVGCIVSEPVKLKDRPNCVVLHAEIYCAEKK